jgi:hypothetical protein
MRRVLGWAAAAVGGVLALLLLMHAFISPVNPRQEAPKTHVQSACWSCHTVSDSVKVKDLGEDPS